MTDRRTRRSSAERHRRSAAPTGRLTRPGHHHGLPRPHTRRRLRRPRRTADRHAATTPQTTHSAPPTQGKNDRRGQGRDATAQSVSVTFRNRGIDKKALDTVAFTALPGSATAIIGPSGSGKTTLLRVLAGLQLPDTGTLSLTDSRLPTPHANVGVNTTSAFNWSRKTHWPHSTRPAPSARPGAAPAPTHRTDQSPDHRQNHRAAPPGRPALRLRPPLPARTLRRTTPARLHRPFTHRRPQLSALRRDHLRARPRHRNRHHGTPSAPARRTRYVRHSRQPRNSSRPRLHRHRAHPRSRTPHRARPHRSARAGGL